MIGAKFLLGCDTRLQCYFTNIGMNCFNHSSFSAEGLRNVMTILVDGQTVHSMVTGDLVRTIRKVSTGQEVSLMVTRQNLRLACKRLICQESVGERQLPESQVLHGLGENRGMQNSGTVRSRSK